MYNLLTWFYRTCARDSADKRWVFWCINVLQTRVAESEVKCPTLNFPKFPTPTPSPYNNVN